MEFNRFWNQQFYLCLVWCLIVCQEKAPNSNLGNILIWFWKGCISCQKGLISWIKSTARNSTTWGTRKSYTVIQYTSIKSIYFLVHIDTQKIRKPTQVTIHVLWKLKLTRIIAITSHWYHGFQSAASEDPIFLRLSESSNKTVSTRN